MTDLRHVLTVKEFQNAPYGNSCSAFELRGPPPFRVCPPRSFGVRCFSLFTECAQLASPPGQKGPGKKRPPQTSHRVDSVALPQARQHPLRRVTDLETFDPGYGPLLWSLTLVRGHRFPSPKLSLFPSLPCKPVWSTTLFVWRLVAFSSPQNIIRLLHHTERERATLN